MSMGQDEQEQFSNPAWRQAMQGVQMPLLGQPVGNLDFAGIASPQAAVPGITQLLAQIPTAKKPKINRAQRLSLDRFAETGGGSGLLGGATKEMLSGAQRRRMMQQRSQGTHR